MNDARTLAVAALIALLAGAAPSMGQSTAHAQTGAGITGAAPSAADQGEAGTGLAPDQAVTPAERPADVPLAPAEGAPAPAPRPGGATALAPAGTAEDATETAQPTAPETAQPTAPEPPPDPEAPAQAPAPEQVPGAPGTSPEPPPAPEAPAQSPAPEQAPGAPDAAPAPAEDPRAEGAAAGPAPAEPPVPERLAESDAALAACLGQLGARGATFERVDRVSDEGGACGIANPLRVSGIVPGVALQPAAVMRCATAAALADWVGIFVLPASAMLPERGRLTAIEHGSAYVCRGIGGAGGGGGELSQHAFGNALDVMAFRFAEGAAIPVEPRERDGTAAEAFQRTARASACLLFTTVLGPGQADHDDHLHLDIEARGSGHRLCR